MNEAGVCVSTAPCYQLSCTEGKFLPSIFLFGILTYLGKTGIFIWIQGEFLLLV